MQRFFVYSKLKDAFHMASKPLTVFQMLSIGLIYGSVTKEVLHLRSTGYEFSIIPYNVGFKAVTLDLLSSSSVVL
jgi:hypothetical protein